MKVEAIEALLRLLNSKRTGYRAGWVEGYCPLAPWKHSDGKDSHPSFGIKASKTKKSFCKCMSCGFGGDLYDLVYRIRELERKEPASGYNLTEAVQLIANEFADLDFDMSSINDYVEHVPKVDHPFPEDWLNTFPCATKAPVALDYLTYRGVSTSMTKYLDIRYDPSQNRVCFPFRNKKKALMGLQGRFLGEDVDMLRYYQYGFKGERNLHVWMGEDTIDLDRPLVLLEGPFDFTSVLRVYDNVAASFTSGLSVEKLKRLSDAVEIITFYDHGAGGNAARLKISQVLVGVPVTHVIPTKEQGDAGAMDYGTVEAYLEQVVSLRPFKS